MSPRPLHVRSNGRAPLTAPASVTTAMVPGPTAYQAAWELHKGLAHTEAPPELINNVAVLRHRLGTGKPVGCSTSWSRM